MPDVTTPLAPPLPPVALPDRIQGAAHDPRRHESAHKHVSGEAVYVDDIAEPAGLLHVYLGLSTRAHARIRSIDLSPVRQAPGVVAVFTAADVPGVNDIGCMGKQDEPLFASSLVEHVGQPVFAVAAETRDHARRAARLAVIEYEDLPAVLTIAAARDGERTLVTPPMTLRVGDADAALAAAPHRAEGRLAVGGQEHFYLESQIAMAVPGEDDDVLVHVSTQHPTEVQHIVAHVLHVPSHAVTVEVRRMGGGFGGKETQSNLFAACTALVAKRTGRAAKLRPDRDDDFQITGKRHDFEIDYRVGFDGSGLIHGVDMLFAARAGYAADLSGPVTDRALFHADNGYFYPAARLESLPLKTNTVSNTAFRGFGGPQGMVAAERVIDEIAFALGKDPLEIRKRNFYGDRDRNLTPYHQTVTDNILPELVAQLERTCDYWTRREDIRAFNRTSRILRKGLALTPVKFGISFTATHYNQAGALVHVYTDGSIQLNHGGIEMGQGLYTKVAQVVAEEFQVDIDTIRPTATNTGKVPNTSATAASSGSDLNGKAAQAAARTIKERLVAFAAENWGVPAEAVRFERNRVWVGDRDMSFAELVRAAYMARVQLSATGFYKTPKIHWDRAAGRGTPFYYFAYGAACAEVTVDTLTGEYVVDRVDILHDCGRSLNPAIDRGQIEGGFVQGMGWLTMEELWWDAQGRLRTHAPSTYKIPACSDRPRIFNVALLDDAPNREDTIFRSKAVGEPPFMLGMSVLHALSDAVASTADHRLCPRLDAPATPERVLSCIMALRQRAATECPLPNPPPPPAVEGTAAASQTAPSPAEGGGGTGRRQPVSAPPPDPA
ncbi:xanthine dehydrogenase molybdopterin binding subunit [Azospirillum picis]|uniref:Xanthine dehydrogenase large subunit n=1 Tax=Azospirillum picis TaxID=488438 RepID=A0ABU0MHS2_9PROT|nr:xanthine dehydrogenase molybdopterin binding subunit [Azospirillum picis]MBP2299352.1 xanthine dehydrogenase large subunit [Azospirillum picis]MDQ0533010.1 xanthine dehydrogenase large subunit [Azospirillum picis]